MKAETITCPVCGFRFDPSMHRGCSACPLHNGCSMVCCPRCGHSDVDAGRSRAGGWARRAWDRLTSGQAGYGAAGGKDWVRTLAEARMGECVKVAGFSERMPITRRAQLQAYGVWAGSPVWVLQHAPVTIIRVEHCELALERELARQIEIEPEIKLQ